MNYLIMKSIIEATITHFSCKTCGGKILDRNVRIVNTSGQTVNMEVICPKCQTSGVIKAEINMFRNLTDFSNSATGVEFAGTLELPTKTVAPEGAAILDSDILALRDKLSHSTSVEDLLH